ncbi:GAF domain-containing protein [Rhodovulum sp. DZ06]|uniref:GAF domain-containing protein n=1 Tax=Rhodovulum sp. DZ06 TaxID=3425126 RepID=UPI003D32BE77
MDDANAPADAAALRFIEAVEVWIPSPDGDKLILASADYGRLTAFGDASRNVSFARGEGLPGRAWAEARPVLINPLAGSGFVRIEAAAEAGLTCALAVPFFAGQALKGVAVLLCAEDEARSGAVEIWAEDKAAPGVLALSDGYYGAAKAFEAVSRAARFARGKGLPGGAWAAQAAMLLRDLGGSFRFVRAEAAGEAGLTTGLGIPLELPGGETLALALLSAKSAPIAGRFEIWDAAGGSGKDGRDMILVDGVCDRRGPLWGQPRRAAPWQGPIGRVAATGAPVAVGGPEAAGLPAGWASCVALPIHRKGRLAQVAAWYF